MGSDASIAVFVIILKKKFIVMVLVLLLLFSLLCAAVPSATLQRLSSEQELTVLVEPCGGLTQVFDLGASVLDVRSGDEDVGVEHAPGVTKIFSSKSFVLVLRAGPTFWSADGLWMDSPHCDEPSGIPVPRLACRIVILRSAMCFGSTDAQLTVDSNGLAPLDVAWSDTSPRGGQAVAVRVRDAVGRVCNDAVVVPPVQNLDATIEVTPISCAGGRGVLNLTVQGGTPPYNFRWSGGKEGCFSSLFG